MTKLKELVKYIQPSNYLVKSTNYSDEYNTPVLTPNKSFLLGYTNEENTFNRDCIIIDDFTLDVKYVDFPFMLKSSASKILVSDQMDLYYLYYLLKTYPFVLNGHGRHYISYVQEIEFDIPSLEEQQKIGSFPFILISGRNVLPFFSLNNPLSLLYTFFFLLVNTLIIHHQGLR